jgi:septum formation topological specificity factor MinE
MKSGNTERIRERILALIDSHFESDAAFEREMGIPDKTVNNWRRGRSASFMRMLPVLSERFSVNVGELLHIPISHDTSELSEDELELLALYRRTGAMPERMRAALKETLMRTIELYVESAPKKEHKVRGGTAKK